MAFQKGNQYAKGMKHTPEWKEEAKKRMLGNTNGFQKGHKIRLGKKWPEGHYAWSKGMKLPEKSGENHPRWIKDRTSVMEKHRLRGTYEWKEWRSKVFERDLYTCQICNKSGCYLEAHHIKSFSEYPKLRFEISNGITLCQDCHIKIDKFRRNFYERK